MTDVPAVQAPLVQDWIDRAKRADPRAVARLISWIEDSSPAVPEVMAQLAPTAGRARVIGLTGAPGVGKSTTTSALIAGYRKRDQRVGVIAVDPSSPFSGGALLGDRIRMQDHALDDGVVIRSMASRGHLGGLAATTPQAVRVFEAAGVDVVIIETVGVGQSEVEVAGTADTTVVLLAPGMGDGIQAAKAGILEVGDVFCVNKADRDGADSTAREVRHMISLADRDPHRWEPQVVKAVASRGEVDELLAVIDLHQEWLTEDDRLEQRRQRRATEEITALTLAHFRRRIGTDGHQQLLVLAQAVATGSLDPYSAADRLIASIGED
ncbi:MAG: methylmalonyl Co-A mutase-associated GTPase MeaB [Candidatus Nanopelagicales bacterium]